MDKVDEDMLPWSEKPWSGWREVIALSYEEEDALSSSSRSESDSDCVFVTGGTARVTGAAFRKESLGMLRRKGIVGMR